MLDQPIKLNRDHLRMIASGAYLQINKGYDQQTHAAFIEGALFFLDFIAANERSKIVSIARGSDVNCRDKEESNEMDSE